MIYNYTLTHHAIYNSTFDNLLLLLERVENQNIVLILDKANYLINYLDKELKDNHNTSDYIFKKIQTLVIELIKNNKIYRNHESIYNKENISDYLKQILKHKIEIDAVIVSDDEKNDYDNAIDIENYNLHKIENERRELYNKGIVEVEKKSKDFLFNNLKKLTWNSNEVYYYDYNLNKVDREYLQKKWVHGLVFFAKAYADSFIGNNVAKPKLKILTPLYKSRMNDKNKSEIERINYIKENFKRISDLEDKIISKVKEFIDVELFFYDPKDHDNPKRGNKGHNRYVQTYSAIVDFEDGLDIFDANGEVIEHGDWTFALKSKESLGKIRSLVKYTLGDLQKLQTSVESN